MVGPPLDIFRNDLAADHLTALLIEREGRLAVELPAVVERMRHAMTKGSVVLACEIAINLHRPGLRAARMPATFVNVGHRAIHSITSSARASNEGGTVRPSALAVLRLTTSSNLVGCAIGKSAGLLPLKILST